MTNNPWKINTFLTETDESQIVTKIQKLLEKVIVTIDSTSTTTTLAKQLTKTFPAHIHLKKSSTNGNAF